MTPTPSTHSQTGSRHSPYDSHALASAREPTPPRAHLALDPRLERLTRDPRACTTVSAGRRGSSTSSSRRKRALGPGSLAHARGAVAVVRRCAVSGANGRASPVIDDIGRCRGVLMDSEMRFRPCAASSAPSWGVVCTSLYGVTTTIWRSAGRGVRRRVRRRGQTGTAERQRYLRCGRCKVGGRDKVNPSPPSSRSKPRGSRSITDSSSGLTVSVQRISSCSRRGQCQSSLAIGSKLATKGAGLKRGRPVQKP